MPYWIVDYINEDIEGSFKSKDRLIDALLDKIGDIEIVDSYKEAKELYSALEEDPDPLDHYRDPLNVKKPKGAEQ